MQWVSPLKSLCDFTENFKAPTERHRTLQGLLEVFKVFHSVMALVITVHQMLRESQFINCFDVSCDNLMDIVEVTLEVLRISQQI